ncbi:MAG: calcium/sodium antiporter, partial [Gammaproteobacteria bacterium]|nr:calcium/sodium antiporter [Gammaproteobacteria bacterium]
MNTLVPWLLAAAVGLALLAFGARLFIEGAADGARRLRISPMLVGMFLAGFATSMPEAVVAAVAAYRDSVELALGNAVGSNIANIGLVLGAAVLLMGMRRERGAGGVELGVMSAVTALACLLVFNQYLSRLDGLLLLAAMPLVAWLLVRNAGLRRSTEIADDQAQAPLRSLPRNAAYAAGGLLLLLGGAELLVRAAQQVAMIAGVEELVIGATIVAIGTSLPEL